MRGTSETFLISKNCILAQNPMIIIKINTIILDRILCLQTIDHKMAIVNDKKKAKYKGAAPGEPKEE